MRKLAAAAAAIPMIAYVYMAAVFRKLFPGSDSDSTGVSTAASKAERAAKLGSGEAVVSTSGRTDPQAVNATPDAPSSQSALGSAAARSIRNVDTRSVRGQGVGLERSYAGQPTSPRMEPIDRPRVVDLTPPLGHGLDAAGDLGAHHKSYGVAIVQVMAIALAVALLVSGLLLGLPSTGGVSIVAPPTFTPLPPQAGAGRTQGDVPLDVGYQLKFTKPMNQASVRDAITITPNVGLKYRWDATSQTVALMPDPHWNPKTVYLVVVGTNATDQQGLGLATEMSASFQSGDLTSGTVTATQVVDTLVSPGTAFQISFTRPVKLFTVQAHLTIALVAPCPPVNGESSVPINGICPPVGGVPQVPTCPAVNGVSPSPVKGICPGAIPMDIVGDDPTDVASQVFTATPQSQLAAKSTFVVSFSSGSGKTEATDAAGSTLQPVPSLQVTTMAAPAVLRFLPRSGSTTYDTNSPISVLFTTAMDTKSTASAFSVTDDGVAVSGTKRWSQGNTVLTLIPRASFGVGSTIVATVTTAARAVGGLHIDAAAVASFKVSARPAARISGGGGRISGSPWHGSEVYYMALMNCTRTGGWVTSRGTCSSVTHHTLPAQGGLSLNSGISNAVSRPYAKFMADKRLLSHYLCFGGCSPPARMCAKGYCGGSWGENIASPSSTSTGGMVSIEIFYQNEYWCRCEHYANIMNGHFRSAGVGVWFSNSVRVAIDFYG